MKFYIFLVLIASSYAIDFDCLKGPTFWCASEENAAKCGRVVECFVTNEKVGVKKMSKLETSETCKLCEEIIKVVESQFIPNITEQEFLNFVIISVCPKVGNELKELCVTMVRQYGHQIYLEFTSFLNPDILCTYMGVCNNFTRTSSPETCKICKEVFAFLESMLVSVTPDELKAILKMVICNTLPANIRSMCDTLVDGYTDQVYELLKSLLDGNRVCPALHLCSSNADKKVFSWDVQACIDVVAVLKVDLVNVTSSQVDQLVELKACAQVPSLFRGICDNLVKQNVDMFMSKLHSSMTPAQICASTVLFKPIFSEKKVNQKFPRNIIECDVCQMMVKELRKLLTNPEEVLRIKNFIKTQICKYFGNQQQKCVEFVDKYTDILINFINSQLTNKQICELFGACSESKFTLSQSSSTIAGGIECETCKLILTEIKKFISSPTNQANIKNFLKNTICPFFGKEKTQCQQAVDEYFTIIFNAIISEFDVDSLCKMGKFCTNVSSNINMNRLETVECTVCEEVMSEFINIITTNTSQEGVENFLTTVVCSKIDDLKDECISLVKMYLPYVFKIARESLNSKILCSRLHLCSLVTQEKMNSFLRSMNVKSFKCDLCQFLVNETKALLSDNKIQTILEDFLKNEICSHFGLNKQKCEEDITEYYSLVINLILQFLTPNICADIRLCESLLQKVPIHQPWKSIMKSKKPIECVVCPKIYNFLKGINTKTANNDIVLGIVLICSRHYHEDKRRCLNLLKKLDLFIELIQGAKNEEDYCKMTKMCAATIPLLGLKKCSWGPGFWCISRRHAHLCGLGAVRHCELNGWNVKSSL